MVANASTQIEIAKRAILPRADARAGEEKFATVSFWSEGDDNITVSGLSTHGLHGFYDQEPSNVASVDQSNQQYSILALTDSNGNVSERYAYTAYGQPTFLNASATVQTSSAAGNRYTYTGREWDATLGLHHFRARWMSGLTGRFLTRDPIGFVDGNNLYNNYMSLVLVDPTGTKCCVHTWHDGWGHAALSCGDNYYSLWPAEGRGQWGCSTHSQYQDEQAFSGRKATTTCFTCDLDEKAIAAEWAKIKQECNWTKWSNCATAVFRMLLKGRPCTCKDCPKDFIKGGCADQCLPGKVFPYYPSDVKNYFTCLETRSCKPCEPICINQGCLGPHLGDGDVSGD